MVVNQAYIQSRLQERKEIKKVYVLWWVTMKQKWENVDNYWSWVMGTQGFYIILFFVDPLKNSKIKRLLEIQILSLISSLIWGKLFNYLTKEENAHLTELM